MGTHVRPQRPSHATEVRKVLGRIDKDGDGKMNFKEKGVTEIEKGLVEPSAH